MMIILREPLPCLRSYDTQLYFAVYVFASDIKIHISIYVFVLRG